MDFLIIGIIWLSVSLLMYLPLKKAFENNEQLDWAIFGTLMTLSVVLVNLIFSIGVTVIGIIWLIGALLK